MTQKLVNKTKLLFLFAFFAVAFLCTNKQTKAQENSAQPGFILEPAFQEIVISNSQPESETTIQVSNTTNQAESFEIFGIEFPSTQHFGSLHYLDFGQSTIKQQPNYLKFDASQFVINPQETRTITLKVTDRADLRPGGTYTAIVVRALSQAGKQQQQVLPAFASLLLIRKIDGEIRNLSLTNLSGSTKSMSGHIPSNLTVTFQNSGNVHLVPRGQITVTDTFGRIISQGILNEESFYVLPDTQKEIQVKLHKSTWSYPIAFLTVRAFGASETTSYASEYSYLYISPILIATILLPFFSYIYRMQKNKKKYHTKIEINIKKIE